MATKIAYWTEHKSESEDKQYLVHPSSNGYEGVRRTINLLVRESGQIVDETDEITIERKLDLGNQGDNLVTLIHFDTHELQWGSADSDHTDEEGDYFLKHEYEPVIHFFNPDKERGALNPISFKFEGGDFFIPQELTKEFGQYQIIYSLREQLVSGDTPGNVGESEEENYREVFISNVFYGEVKETLFSSENFNQWIEADVLNERQDFSYLKKPSIVIGLNGDTKQIAIEGDENVVWGNLQDSLVTDIKINFEKWKEYLKGDWSSENSLFYAVFIPDEAGATEGLQPQPVRMEYDSSFQESGSFYTYLPSIVTQTTNKWAVQLFASPERTAGYYNYILPNISSKATYSVDMEWMSNEGMITIKQISFNPIYNNNGKRYWYGFDEEGKEHIIGERGQTIKLASYNSVPKDFKQPKAAISSQYFFAEPIEIQVSSNFLQGEDLESDEEQNIVDIPENALYDTYRFALTAPREGNPGVSDFIITNEEFSFQLTQTGHQVQEILNWVDENKEWVKQEDLATKNELKNLDNKYKEATTVEFSEDIDLYYYEVGDNLSGQYIKSDKISESAWSTVLKTKNGSNISLSGADGNWYFNIVYLDGSYEEIGINPQLFEYKFPWTEDNSYEIVEISDAAAFNTNILYSRVSLKESIIQLNESQTENSNKIQELNEFTSYAEDNYAKSDDVETLNRETKEEIINIVVDAGKEEWSRVVGDFQAQRDATIFLRVTQENAVQEIFTREGQRVYWHEASGTPSITNLVDTSFAEPQLYGFDGDARIFSFTTPEVWEGETLSCTQNDIAYVVNVSGIVLKNYYNKNQIDENQSSLWRALSSVELKIDGKQEQLESGTNIKTINGESILGSGNITIKGGGDVPEGLEQRLGGIEQDIRTLQQGLDGTLSIANGASQTANATARNLSEFTSYAEQNYATKTNTYTKAEVDQKIANAGGGNDKYEYIRDDSIVYLVGDSEIGKCQTLYIKEDSTGYGKDLIGVFDGADDIWFHEGGYISIDGLFDYECQQVNDTVWSVSLPSAMNGSSISPNDTNLNAYFVKQVEKSNGSIKLTDLRGY